MARWRKDTLRLITNIEKISRDRKGTTSEFLGMLTGREETFALLGCFAPCTSRNDKYFYQYWAFGPVPARLSIRDNQTPHDVDILSLYNSSANTNLRGTSTSIASHSSEAFQYLLHSRMKKGITSVHSKFVFADFGYSFIPTPVSISALILVAR